jgi:protein-S-isoprenylcysteine O-methyltransferase Ste14
MKNVPATGGGAVKKEYGGLLVACQFLLLLLLVATTDWHDITLSALLFFIASLLLAGWAVKVMRLGHFNVLPTIKSGAILTTHGPYRYIRHPMYASLLLGGVGLLLISCTWLRLAAFFGLWLVLYCKLRIEEKLLADHFPDYSLYQKRSRMLFPWF